jgi:hypothetical protein
MALNVARVAELVDAIDLGSIVLGRASSSLAPGTTLLIKSGIRKHRQTALARFPTQEKKWSKLIS